MSIEIFMKLVEILDTDANRLLGSMNLREGDVQCREIICRIRNLKQGDREIVVKTVKVLVEGFRQYR